MSNEEINNIRHTLAHLLAAAVKELYPYAKPTTGPAIENGFYYDFDFSDGEKITERDLKKIEQKMRELLKKWEVVSGEIISEEKARKLFEKNKYKLELIDEIVDKKEDISVYHSGGGDEKLTVENALFTDLCAGGHCVKPKDTIKNIAFRLDRISGAYWRGDEKNTMLTRIYGLAFESKEALKKYDEMLEEAKKRDHRKLGKELDLFTFSELVGSGLPMWTPKGTILRNELDNFVWDLRKKHNYSRVTIPHLTKKDLYETSGHWEKFSDELFKVNTREGKEYALKPMNCPHHTQIFARRPHSYREMPQRYAETTMVYRDEQSGELGGLTRVLSITQDDSHVFCRATQVKDEFMKIWEMIDTLYSTFNFDLRVRLSFHDPKEMDKYLGDEKIWENAENSLREIAEERKANYFEAPGEAAMYGPKLDFIATDSLGREHQVATIQLDLNMPERFDLTCVNEKGEKERVVMIHAAIMGSIERFTAVLLEHLSGHLPFWLSPVQLRIIPVADTHKEYANKLFEKLKNVGIRAEINTSKDSFGKKVRLCKTDKIPYFICVGDKEVNSGVVTLESNTEKIEKKEEEVVEFLKDKIKNREM
jgi:threonyl-tRNA synthetase